MKPMYVPSLTVLFSLMLMFSPRGIYPVSMKDVIERKEAYQTANNSTHVENAPEPSKVHSLLVLVGIRDHDGALRSPKQGSAETKPDTSKNVEARNMLVDRDEKTDSVETVANTTEGKTKLDTKLVDKSAAENTNHSKSTVERGVLAPSQHIDLQLVLITEPHSPYYQPEWDQFYHRRQALQEH